MSFPIKSLQHRILGSCKMLGGYCSSEHRYNKKAHS